MAQTDYPKATWHPSGNYWKGNDPQHGRLPVRCITLHGTGGLMPGCLEWLCDPNSNVSAHYVVARNGTVFQLVREVDVSWANGEVSTGGIYPALPNVNRFTAASIETENDRNNALAYTDAQYAAVVDLIRNLRSRYGNLPLIPHRLIDPVNRPFCPGPQIPVSQIDHDSSISIVPSRPWPSVYLQRDKQWATHDLGNAPDASIGDFGCYIACDAMVSAYYGHPATPLTLNAALLARGIYVPNVEGYKDLMPDDALAHLYGDVQAVGVHDWTDVPADLAVLAALSKDPTLCTVIEVDFDHDPSNGTQSHFVLMDSCDGQRVWVLDPWYGDGHHADDLSKNFGSNIRQTIQKAVVYRSTPVTAPVPIPIPPRPKPSGDGQHYQLTVAMKLRRVPVQFSPPYGALLPVGTRVARASPPKPLPPETTNWLYCRTSGDLRGYLKKSGLVGYTPEEGHRADLFG